MILIQKIIFTLSKIKKAKNEKIKEEIANKDIKECTFKPKINSNYPVYIKPKKEKEKYEKTIDSMIKDNSETKKPKKKMVKNKKKIITDSDQDSDFIIEDEKEKEKESSDEISTPIKTNKKNKKGKLNGENSTNGIDLNNFMKETLDKELKEDPNCLNSNIRKTFQGSALKQIQNNKSELETPSMIK